MSTAVWVISIRLLSSRVNFSPGVAVLSTWWASMVSLKMEAVSARGMGALVIMLGRPAMQRLCQAWPSSWAMVLTSEKLPWKLVITRLRSKAWAPAQKAPPLLPARGNMSIHRCSKALSMNSAIFGVNLPSSSISFRRASSTVKVRVFSPTGANRS